MATMQWPFLLALLGLSCTTLPWHALAQPMQQAIFINAGASEYIDLDGNNWEPDTPYVNTGRSFVTDAAISGTELDPVYQSERYGKDMVYTIPLPSGVYDIDLLFAGRSGKPALSLCANISQFSHPRSSHRSLL